MRLAETAPKLALKNILLMTDFSQVSETALWYAKGIALRYASDLFATHVIEPAATLMMPPEGWGACQQAIEESAGRYMQRLDGQLQGVAHHLTVRHGYMREAISQAIEENHIDLLVIGTHGRAGMGRLLMGSVAEEVFRRFSCPVLTVGPNVRTKDAPGADFRQIIFATDFSHDSLAAFPHAVAWAEDYRAHLALVHVVNQSFGPLTDAELITSNCVRDLSALIEESGELWCEPECIVDFGNPAECILRTARKRNADLIVLGVRAAHGRIGAATHAATAIAHTLVSLSSCPVLTVRG